MKYEYMIQAQQQSNVVALNERGEEGWELVTQHNGTIFYFKRSLPEKPEPVKKGAKK